MISFISGSYAYGVPHKDSDIDLVMLVESEDVNLLWEHSDKEFSTCRYGKLNLVTFTNKDRFEKWKEVTDKLKNIRPVTREFAISAFQEAGFTGKNYAQNRAENQTSSEVKENLYALDN